MVGYGGGGRCLDIRVILEQVPEVRPRLRTTQQRVSLQCPPSSSLGTQSLSMGGVEESPGNSPTAPGSHPLPTSLQRPLWVSHTQLGDLEEDLWGAREKGSEVAQPLDPPTGEGTWGRSGKRPQKLKREIEEQTPRRREEGAGLREDLTPQADGMRVSVPSSWGHEGAQTEGGRSPREGAARGSPSQQVPHPPNTHPRPPIVTYAHAPKFPHAHTFSHLHAHIHTLTQ